MAFYSIHKSCLASTVILLVFHFSTLPSEGVKKRTNLKKRKTCARAINPKAHPAAVYKQSVLLAAVHITEAFSVASKQSLLLSTAASLQCLFRQKKRRLLHVKMDWLYVMLLPGERASECVFWGLTQSCFVFVSGTLDYPLEGSLEHIKAGGLPLC